MKTKFKKVIPVLILLIALIFNSCETQEEIVRNDNKNVNVENKSFKELENNSLFNRAYSKFNITKLARTTSRTGIEDTYNFTIDPSLIKVITSDEKVSYNFLVRRDSIDTGKYENLVLEVKNSEEVSAYIFKYLEYNDEVSYKNGLPEIMLLNLEGENLENRIIQFCYKIPVAVSCNQAGTCGETTYVYGPHPIGPCCSNSSFYNYETQTQCNTYDIVGFDNFSGGGGSGGGGNPFSGDVFILTNPQNFNGVGTPQNGATSLNVNVISVSENDITNNNIHNNDSPYNSFYNGLNQEQKDWLNNHLNIRLNINQYLQNNHDEDDFNFIQEAIVQMMQNPDLIINFETSSKSPCFVDISNINNSTPEGQKFTEVYNILKQSSKFRELFTNLFGVTNFINAKFKIENITQSGVAGNCQLFSSSFGGLRNEIIIDRNVLLTNSNVNIATVIIHECIHAFLNVKLRHPNIGMSINNINNLNLQDCINTYYNSFSGNQSQHDFFVDFLIPTIYNILSELKEELLTSQQILIADNPIEPNQYIYGINQTNPATFNDDILPWSWSDYFYYQSQSGLQNCSAFNIINPLNSPNYLNFIQYISKGTLIFNP
jgi:hypothetical protein